MPSSGAADPGVEPGSAPASSLAGPQLDRAPAADRHTWFEDAQAIVTACAFFSLGLALLGGSRLLMGGTPGIALLVSRVTGLRFGPVYFLVNLPFFWLGLRRLGWRFTLKTFSAIALLALVTDRLPAVLHLDRVHPVYAAAMGGALAGVGLLMLFRHDASLGGLSILAVWLQERFGIRAGMFQLSVDLTILVASFFFVSPAAAALSVLGAVALNLVLAINHKPGRYMGT
jgi:uncharacterized membrane-anchored protein YitT (DUF2179 family)